MMNDIDNIIEKYFTGESSIEEEQTLAQYVLSDSVSDNHKYLRELFQHFEAERSTQHSFEPDLSFVKDKKTKIRFLIPKLLTIAASLLILIAVSFNWFGTTETMYKDKYTQLEDPEEALAITLEALGFLGKKFDEGTKSLKHVKKLEKTAVFSFDK